MYKYEVRLRITLSGNTTYVHTIITAGSIDQARQLALAQAGVGGELIFDPYEIQ